MKWNSGRLWLRIAVYSLVSVIGLGIIAQALIIWQFNEESVRRTLAGALAQSGRRIEVSGRISPHLLPAPGLDLEQVTVTGTDGRTPFARAARVEADLAWWPLLFGTREVKAVSLTGFEVEVVRRFDGRLSVADLFQRRSNDRFQVKLDTLRLRDGQIRYNDLRSNTVRTLQSLSLDATHLRDEAQLSAGAVIDVRDRPVRLSVQTPLTIQDDQITLSALDALALSDIPGAGQSRIAAKGLYRLNLATFKARGEKLFFEVSTEKPASTLTLTLPEMNASIDRVEIPHGQLNGTLDYARSQYKLHAQLDSLTLTEAGLTTSQLGGQLAWSAGKLQVNVGLSGGLALTGLNRIRVQPLVLNAQVSTPLLPRGQLLGRLEGLLEGSLDEARLDLNASGQLDGAPITVQLTQFGFARPSHEANIALSRLDLNRYLPEAPASRVAIFQDKRPLPLEWMDFLDLNAKLAIGELAVGRFRMNDVNADLKATPYRLDVNQLSATIYEGRLEGTARLLREDTPRLEVNQTLTGMNIQPLLVDLFNFTRLEGKGNGRINLQAEGPRFIDLRDSLTGNVAMSLNRGALTGIDLVNALKNLPGEMREWNSPAQAGQKTTFSTLAADFRLESGVARNQDLTLASQLVNVSGGGKADLRQGIIDYTLDVRANPREFTKLRGINVPLKITGPIDAPVYALDFNSLVKGKKTESEKQEVLRQELKRQMTTILPTP